MYPFFMCISYWSYINNISKLYYIKILAKYLNHLYNIEKMSTIALNRVKQNKGYRIEVFVCSKSFFR